MNDLYIKKGVVNKFVTNLYNSNDGNYYNIDATVLSIRLNFKKFEDSTTIHSILSTIINPIQGSIEIDFPISITRELTTGHYNYSIILEKNTAGNFIELSSGRLYVLDTVVN